MEIISKKINNQIEAVLYDDGGNPLMTLPRIKDRKGKEWLDVPDEILQYMENQQKGLPNYKEDADAVDIMVDNYKKHGTWDKPTALDKLVNQTKKVDK
tara:strand:- start:222 stop:515 length:294 start_codon:yes stop_codon:yes gene_type:complete